MTATIDVVAERELLSVPARAAATAWLNAWSASSKDQHRGVLYGTISLEFFKQGLHLIACDGQVLFRCWVPTAEARELEEMARWPGDGEAPEESVVVRTARVSARHSSGRCSRSRRTTRTSTTS